jgi:hypothetical protein
MTAIETSPTTNAILHPPPAHPDPFRRPQPCTASMTAFPPIWRLRTTGNTSRDIRTLQRCASQGAATVSLGGLSFHGGPRITRLHNTSLHHDCDGSDHETDRGIARRHFELIRTAIGAVWRVHIGRWTGDSNLAVLRRRYDLQPGPPDIALAWRIGRVENLLRSNRWAVAPAR